MTTYSIIYLIGAIILAFGVLKTIKFGKREFELKKEKDKPEEWKKESELQECISQRKKHLKICFAALGIIYISLTLITFL